MSIIGNALTSGVQEPFIVISSFGGVMIQSTGENVRQVMQSFDTNCFSRSGTSVYVCKTAGDYEITLSASSGYDSSGAVKHAYYNVRKNGSIFLELTTNNVNTASVVSKSFHLDVGDELSLRGKINGSGSSTLRMICSYVVCKV